MFPHRGLTPHQFMRMSGAHDCMQRTRRLRFASMLNVYRRRVADAVRYAPDETDQQPVRRRTLYENKT